MSKTRWPLSPVHVQASLQEGWADDWEGVKALVRDQSPLSKVFKLEDGVESIVWIIIIDAA